MAKADLKKLKNRAGKLDRSNVNVEGPNLCSFFPVFCVATS